MTIQLKKAIKTDIDFITSAEKAEVEDAYILAWTAKQHLAGILDENLLYLMIRTEGRTVGFFILAYEPDGTSMEFKRIVITKKGQGLGQMAIRAMIDFVFSNLGKNRLWLDVYEDNHRAQHIYEKLGFTFQKREPFEGRFLKIYQLIKPPGEN